MIKQVLFDLDGVLADLVHVHAECFSKALKQVANVELSKEDIVRLNGLPTREKLNILAKENRITSVHQASVGELKQSLTENFIDTMLQPDQSKIDLMIYLRQKDITIACVSNAVHETVLNVLIKMNLLEYCRTIVSNRDVLYHKPNPAPYLYAMSKTGIGPKHTLIVEDSRVGLEAAREARAHVWDVNCPTAVTLEQYRKIESRFPDVPGCCPWKFETRA